jgi:hypothetical protein
MADVRAQGMMATPLQKAATVMGIVFLAVGVLGFIPGITTNYGTMTFAGHHSDAMLLGIFQVSVLHNIVHLLLGAAGLALARSEVNAWYYLIGGGIIYLALWIYGLVVSQLTPANFVPLNNADDWLHLVLGVVMIVLGLALGRTRSARTTGAPDLRT